MNIIYRKKQRIDIYNVVYKNLSANTKKSFC